MDYILNCGKGTTALQMLLLSLFGLGFFPQSEVTQDRDLEKEKNMYIVLECWRCKWN